MDQAGVMSPQGRVRPGWLQVWLQASRAFTLGMPFMSVTVGSFLAFYTGAISRCLSTSRPRRPRA
jgi:hypothetical protein